MPDDADWSVIVLSLKVATLATLSSLPFAIGLAWVLARKRFVGRLVVDALVYAPLVLPPVVVGYLLLVLFGMNGPIGHWFFEHFGVRFIFTTKAAVLASAIMAFPLIVRGVQLSIEAIDVGLEEAAATLGSGPWAVFFRVTLPLSLPGIISGGIVGFARALGEFGATITFASNIEGQTRTLPLAIYTLTQTANGDAQAMRLVVVSMVLALAAVAASSWLERSVARVLGRRPAT